MEKFLDLGLRAKAHDTLDAGAVVPTAVEQHHLSCGGQVSGVALKVPLGLFAFGRSGESDHPADAWVETFGDALDSASFACGIAAFKNCDDLKALLLDPLL